MKLPISFVTALVFFALSNLLSAQTAPGKYWIRFTDKSGTPYSLNQPERFLSARCIERRLTQGLGFDERDLPVNPAYIQAVLNAGNCQLHNVSKWFNAITITLPSPENELETLEAIGSLPMVAEIRAVVRISQSGAGDKWKEPQASGREKIAVADSGKYGPSFHQIRMLNGHLIHDLGYTGQGITIAVLDAGWNRTDILPAFDHLREEGRIAMTRDFVTPGQNGVYANSNHGTFVLSHMAGIISDSLMGTAPDATYYLFRTEDTASEFLVEEDNWVAAAEFCDSLGIDIINSSLGYSLFDDPAMNHSYADMNGESTRSSIAADIAAEKGILVVNSAGNSGNSPWRFITAPSDGDLVMCVGAVDAAGNHAFFSSFGPSSDGDVKPNVVAMGQQTWFADLDSTVRTGNGTSFSSPIIAGMAASLWSAFPHKTSREIFTAIEESAHLYQNPNDSLGHGIPDFWRAFETLRTDQTMPTGELNAMLYPNPASDMIRLTVNTSVNGPIVCRIFDSAGREVLNLSPFYGYDELKYYQAAIDISALESGHYVVHLRSGDLESTLPLLIIKP